MTVTSSAILDFDGSMTTKMGENVKLRQMIAKIDFMGIFQQIGIFSEI